MTYTLTANEILYLRDDLADTEVPFAFTDTDLNRNFDRNAGDYDQTLLMCLRQLLTSTAKLYNYTSGFTRQEYDTVFKHLQDRLFAEEKRIKSKSQMRSVGIFVVPPKGRTEPDASGSKLVK